MKSSPKRPRGMTVLEVLIASSLLLIVLGLSYMFLVFGVRSYLQIRASVDVQQDALVALSRMSREISESAPETTLPPMTPGPLLPSTGPEGIVFASPRNDEGRIELDPVTMKPLWFKRVAYWHSAVDGKLYRAEQPLATPSTTPPPPDPTFDTQWFVDNGVNKREFPGQLHDFELTAGPSGESLRIRLVNITVESDKPFTVEVLSSATLRN